VHALEAGEHRHLMAVREPLDELLPIHVEDACRGMGTGCQDRQLPALPGAGVDAHSFQHERQQAGGDLLAR
jgi:hypothetical protein